MHLIKSLIMVASLLSIGALSVGCGYGSTATTKSGHVVVTKDDYFLFGGLRSVYVCQVTPNGLADCHENESP